MNTDASGVTLGATQQSSDRSVSGGAGHISGTNANWSVCVDSTPQNTRIFRGDCTGEVDGTGDLAGAPGGPGAPGAPGGVVTIDDVARFVPADAVLHDEPDGWAVTRVPANFWVEVRAVTVQAPLLGKPAEVRFTPVAYRWSYGDGVTRTTATAGAPWASLGQQDLTRTATSHDYLQRAHAQARVTVIYSAAYRVGGGAFIPIDGAVAGEAPPVPVLVVNEKTVLTNGNG